MFLHTMVHRNLTVCFFKPLSKFVTSAELLLCLRKQIILTREVLTLTGSLKK